MNKRNILKLSAVGLSLFAVAQTAQSKVVIDFYDGIVPADETSFGTSVTLSFSNLAEDTGITFSGPPSVAGFDYFDALNSIDTPVTVNFAVLDGTDNTFDAYTGTGSFSITVEAVSATPGYNTTTGAFTTGAELIKGERNGTAGTGVDDDRLRANEAVIYTFDTSLLGAGWQLQVLGLTDFGTSGNGTGAVYDSSNMVVGNINADNGDDATRLFSSAVSISNGDFLAFVSTDTGGRQQVGELQLDLVYVPEPSSYGILAGALALILVTRRRRA